MNIVGFVGFLFVFIFLGLTILFIASQRKGFGLKLRDIQAFSKIQEAIDDSVETGTQLHFSLGRGDIIGMNSASVFAGLSMLKEIIQLSSESDKPPMTTSGNAAVTILSQDTLSGAFHDMGVSNKLDPMANRITGLTPFSYVAGVLPIIYDENISTNIFIGHYSSEIALVNDAIEQKDLTAIAGTDDLTGQAVTFSMAEEPLIGEEIYAGGAYVNSDSMHLASLLAEDLMRWVIILGILLGILLKIFGLNEFLMNLLGG